MYQLLLGVILLGAVFPVAVGFIDDHLSLLLTVIPVQVFFKISQLLLGGRGKAHLNQELPPGPEGHWKSLTVYEKDIQFPPALFLSITIRVPTFLRLTCHQPMFYHTWVNCFSQ